MLHAAGGSSANKAKVRGRVPCQPRGVPVAILVLVTAGIRGVSPLLHPQAPQLSVHGGSRWDGARAQSLPGKVRETSLVHSAFSRVILRQAACCTQ